ncbi:MAG: L-lactate permease [Candidatus Woesebacteria bacterium]|nr:L-lactate permease [Candidatus Woesebacteria bacterium]
MFFLAVSPFFLFVVLLFAGRIKILTASLVSLVLTVFLAIFYWKMNLSLVSSAFLKGGLIALDIFLIVFGAILFITFLKKTNIIKNLCFYLGTFSRDLRIQVILLAWFLENFLEGTAGFGTPSTVVAPILVGLGLSPISAVAIALLGNSASVVFGAAGTPIRVGFSGLDISQIPYYSGLFNMVGFLVPVFILFAVTFRKEDWKKRFFEALPFTIFAGLAYSLPAFFITYLGQEFPSIIGSIIGLIIVLLAIKLKFLVPKYVMGSEKKELSEEKLPIRKVIFPYLLLVAFLILDKFLLGGRFFNPGVIFILTSFIFFLFWKKHLPEAGKMVGDSFKKSLGPFFIIAAMSVLAQIMINSGQDDILAQGLKTAALPLIAPVMGAFGSFMTGSATVSNIMFGGLLAKAALEMGIIPAIILSLQLVGAAAGNMIALADIMPALAVVGLKGKERGIIKRVIIPCLIYVLLVGIIGILVV